MPGFGFGVLAMSGSPLRRLPTMDLPLAFRLLAVALVPALRLILAPTPLAEANPWARSAHWPKCRAFPYPDRRPREVPLPREKLGEDVQPFSPSVIQTRMRRWLVSLSLCWEQDKG